MFLAFLSQYWREILAIEIILLISLMFAELLFASKVVLRKRFQENLVSKTYLLYIIICLHVGLKKSDFNEAKSA